MQQTDQVPENWQEIFKKNLNLKLEIQELKQQLAKLTKLFQGSRSERFTSDVSQLSRFDMEQAEEEKLAKEIEHKNAELASATMNLVHKKSSFSS